MSCARACYSVMCVLACGLSGGLYDLDTMLQRLRLQCLVSSAWYVLLSPGWGQQLGQPTDYRGHEAHREDGRAADVWVRVLHGRGGQVDARVGHGVLRCAGLRALPACSTLAHTSSLCLCDGVALGHGHSRAASGELAPSRWPAQGLHLQRPALRPLPPSQGLSLADGRHCWQCCCV